MINFFYYLTLLATISLYTIEHYPFFLPPRDYNSADFEPFIDKETMNIHYQGHHKKYIDELNALIKDKKDLQGHSTKQLIKMKDDIPAEIRKSLIHNAGGHENHTFFWKSISPLKRGPSSRFKKIIDVHFGSIEKYKEKFTKKTLSIIGSGWAWLCINETNKKLVITTTQNQGSPLEEGLIPLMCLDVWEHAYYLKYKNKRAEYINAWWNIVNWQFAEESYNNACAS